MSTVVAASLLDTDVLSGVMRQHPTAMRRAQDYLAAQARFRFSTITRYEILRGLHAKRAVVQLEAFDRLCLACTILPLTDAIIQRAAEIYADLYRKGALIGDADILIAATALEHQLVLVTNNDFHYGRIQGLQIDNWLR